MPVKFPKRMSADQYIIDTREREARIAAAVKALAQLRPSEWDDVMQVIDSLREADFFKE
jgi:hypothetical protein